MAENRSFKLLAVVLSLIGVGLAGWALYVLGNPTVVIRWSTATEFETAGYAIYRSENPEGPFEKVSDSFIPAVNNPISGGEYAFTDRDVEPGVTYYYLLEEIELSGATNREGPVASTAARRGVAEGAIGSLLFLVSIYLIRSASQGRREEPG
jgi:hypothetical protein